ncbi:MAG TPA: DoxX family protein [Polyangia bacterium]|jgi:uncharacterized membrane protein YphA (DoxX/SURF4 family)
MNLGLWIVQVVVGLAFIFAGLLKATRPIPQLAERMKWVAQVSPAQVRFIGVAELLGGLGLILPWATGIAPVLTPVAAAALVVVMILAAVHHIRRNEWPELVPGLVLGALAAWVAWGRAG